MKEVKFNFQEDQDKDPFDCTDEELQKLREKTVETMKKIDEETQGETPFAGYIPITVTSPTHSAPPPQLQATCNLKATRKPKPLTAPTTNNIFNIEINYYINEQEMLQDGQENRITFFVQAKDLQEAFGKAMENLAFKGISSNFIRNFHSNLMIGCEVIY